MANGRFAALQADKAKYNRANNYLKAAYLAQALSVAYFNDFIDILSEFGLNQFEVKHQANRVNKEFNNFYNLLIKDIGEESKLEFAHDFDMMRQVLDEIYDSDEEVVIETVQKEDNINPNI